MTNKQIVLEAIVFIKDRERDFLNRNILNTLWKDFPMEKQEYFKNLLLEQGLIHLNNSWEFSLTTPAQLSSEDDFDDYGNCKKRDHQKDSEIVASYLETSFFKFLKTNETPNSRKVNVKRFIKSNFIKPPASSPDTINETDEGVLFLESLKSRGVIDYKDDELGQVNETFIDDNPPTIRRWFDNPIAPFKVELTNKLDSVYLLNECLPTRMAISEHSKKIKELRVQENAIGNFYHIENSVGTIIGSHNNQSSNSNKLKNKPIKLNTSAKKSNTGKKILLGVTIAVIAGLILFVLQLILTKN